MGKHLVIQCNNYNFKKHFRGIDNNSLVIVASLKIAIDFKYIHCETNEALKHYSFHLISINIMVITKMLDNKYILWRM